MFLQKKITNVYEMKQPPGKSLPLQIKVKKIGTSILDKSQLGT